MTLQFWLLIKYGWAEDGELLASGQDQSCHCSGAPEPSRTPGGADSTNAATTRLKTRNPPSPVAVIPEELPRNYHS